jgi:hypothetical protein
MKRIVSTGKEPLCWALLVPLPAEALKRAAEAQWRKRKRFMPEVPEFEVIAGRGAYSALVERSPGSEGTEDPLAKSLSRAHSGRVYSLWFDLEWDCHIHVFEGGKLVEERENEDPHGVADELHVPLPKPATRVVESYSAARIEGASVAEVKKVLAQLAKTVPLHVEPVEGGVVVWGDDGDIATAVWRVTRALPEATIYDVRRSGDANGISVSVDRGDVELGTFHLPPKKVRDVPTLADVKGARTPGEIADALGIPRKHIGLG